MARTVTQVRDSLKNTLRTVNNTLDLEVGPLFDYQIGPMAPEIAAVETEQDRLKRFYSTDFPLVATPAEAAQFANNFGVSPDIGASALGTIVYFRNSAPTSGTVLQVPIGSLVATIDNSLIYRATATVSMVGDYAATYFNPTTNRYEIAVPIQAVAPGVRYNLPSGRVVRQLSQVAGFDGVDQRTSFSGGTEPEDTISLAKRVQAKFKGLDRNSQQGLVVLAQTLNPTLVKNGVVVRPTDRLEFRRLTDSPAVDLYIDGTNIQPFTESYLAVGGETSIPISNSTVTAITSVSLNAATLDPATYSYVPDTSLEFQLSTRASPSIVLSSPLSANDLVVISGQKNVILEQTQALFVGDNAVFNTDILVRSFQDLPITVSVDVRINSGDAPQIQAIVYNVISEFIEPVSGTIPSILIPDKLSDLLRGYIPEVVSAKVVIFKRKSASINSVESVVPLKNQIPRFDSVSASITVRV